MRIVSVEGLKGLMTAGTFENGLFVLFFFVLKQKFLSLEIPRRKSIYHTMASQNDIYDYIVCG